VADGGEDGRVRGGAFPRDIDVGGDVVARAAFEDELFDYVAVAREDAGGLRVEGSARGKVAECGAQASAHFALVFADFGWGGEGGQCIRAVLAFLLGQRAEVRGEHVLRVGEFHVAVEDVPVGAQGAAGRKGLLRQEGAGEEEGRAAHRERSYRKRSEG